MMERSPARTPRGQHEEQYVQTGCFVGVDLGQSQDPTAITVLRRLEREPRKLHPRYERELQLLRESGQLRRPMHTAPWLPSGPNEKERRDAIRLELGHVERLRLGTRYPEIVKHVGVLMALPQLRTDGKRPRLVVDETGVGAPVTDMMEAAGLKPIGITITGGKEITGRHVPKRDLVSNLVVLLQSGRLRIAGSLPLAPVLVEELLNFRVKINPVTAHDSYGAWREGEHDDLVLATAIAAWVAVRGSCEVSFNPEGWSMVGIHL